MDSTTVQRIAHLARIRISEEEMAYYQAGLDRILALAESMLPVRTEGVPMMAHPLDAVQPLRADVVTEENQREQMQSVAPATLAGLYLVPKVIE